MYRRRLSNGYSAVVSYKDVEVEGEIRSIRVIYFHSIIKSIRGKIIFYDDADKLLFVNILRRFLDKHNITLLEFVIMDNHIHLLHTAENKELAVIFLAELQQNFSFWYNRFHKIEDKLFKPAKVYYKLTKEAILKCAMYILQNPMNACQRIYPHPQDYKWSSYIFHYNFLEKNRSRLCLQESINKANTYSFIINNSTSKEKNVCSPLIDNFFNKNVNLSSFLEINTFFLDSKFTKKEFEIIIQKSVVSKKEIEDHLNIPLKKSTPKNNDDRIFSISNQLSSLLGGKTYISLSKMEKEEIMKNLFKKTKCTILQVSRLLDENIDYVKIVLKET